MTKDTKPKRTRSCGPTVIEWLIPVVIVLAVLAFLYMELLGGCYDHKRVRLWANVNHLKGAFDQYYVEYQQWPKIPGITNAELQSIPISGDIARMLEGKDTPTGNNPRELKFMEFQRKNKSGDPINPYGDMEKSTQGAKDPALYYVKFDTDHDDMIDGPGDAVDQPKGPMKHKVIAWTYKPGRRSKPPELKGSWMQR